MVGIIAAFLILCVILAIASDKFVSYSNFYVNFETDTV